MNTWSRRGLIGAAGAAVAGAVASKASAQAGAAAVKIVGVSCSPHKDKNTVAAMKAALDAAKAAFPQVEVELIDLGGMKIPGDVAAGVPLEPGERDDFPQVEPKLRDPAVGGIIVATPVYFSNMSSLCKAFLDRWMAFRKNFDLRDKVGGAIAVAGNRNGGQEMTIQCIHAAMFCQDMILVSDGKPSPRLGGIVMSGGQGGAAADEAGMNTARSLGRRVAEVAIRMSRGR